MFRPLLLLRLRLHRFIASQCLLLRNAGLLPRHLAGQDGGWHGLPCYCRQCGSLPHTVLCNSRCLRQAGNNSVGLTGQVLPAKNLFGSSLA